MGPAQLQCPQYRHSNSLHTCQAQKTLTSQVVSYSMQVVPGDGAGGAATEQEFVFTLGIKQ